VFYVRWMAVTGERNQATGSKNGAASMHMSCLAKCLSERKEGMANFVRLNAGATTRRQGSWTTATRLAQAGFCGHA